MKTDLKSIFLRKIEKLLGIKSPSEAWQMSDADRALFVQCLRDAGATMTPGTGKIFVNGQEIDFDDLFREFKGDNL